MCDNTDYTGITLEFFPLTIKNLNDGVGGAREGKWCNQCAAVETLVTPTIAVSICVHVHDYKKADSHSVVTEFKHRRM